MSLRFHKTLGVLFFFALSLQFLVGQEISISSELSLRNYFAYEILGEVDDRIIVYRDKGFTKELDVFNREMEHIHSTELYFEKKKVDVFNVVGLDSVFQVLYGFFENDTMEFHMRIYDSGVRMIDSSLVAKVPKKQIRKKITHAVSNDKNRILLSTVDAKENILFLLYNSKTRSVEWSSTMSVDGEFRQSLNDIVLANNGDFVLLLNENLWNTKANELTMVAVSPRNGYQRYINFGFDEMGKSSFFIDFDNVNNKIILCGLYGDKKAKDLKGYFYSVADLNSLTEDEYFTFLPFGDNLYQELLQGKKKKQKVLDDLEIQDVVLRKDGGLIIISEIEREYSRRNPYNNYARSTYDSYSRRGWVDYYNDDIIVTNIAPTGEVDWNKVLYKKQFSQDDDAIFSSFYIVKTPSRLRFIYNDEIKKNNTVSEYLMDPAGRVARNSLLSTEYQNMKLRFKDAVQISSNALIIPSERNYDLNLVRITY